MKIGDNVWVIVQDEDDGVMMALPQIPQKGYIVDIENVNISNTLNIGNCRHVGDVYYILVDNDYLYISPSNIFLSEDIAWDSWESKMRSKCKEIQKKIRCKRPHPQREDIRSVNSKVPHLLIDNYYGNEHITLGSIVDFSKWLEDEGLDQDSKAANVIIAALLRHVADQLTN
jgi:hypothetical protein